MKERENLHFCRFWHPFSQYESIKARDFE